MTYSFRVENINDISDIPENHLEIVRAALPSNRSNALSREPMGHKLFLFMKLMVNLELSYLTA